MWVRIPSDKAAKPSAISLLKINLLKITGRDLRDDKSVTVEEIVFYIKYQKYWWLLVALGILIGMALAIPSHAQSPTNEYRETKQQYIPDILATPTPETLEVKPIKTPPKPLVYTGQQYSKEEVKELIIKYSAEYGIDSSLPLRVALCESGYRWDAKNSHSTASGVFQYIASTWRNTEEGRKGTSPFDADANIRMAILSISHGGIGNWNESKHCWN